MTRGVGEHLDVAGVGIDGEKSAIGEAGADPAVGQYDDVFGR